MTFDVIIKGGEVVDGKGTPRRRADVAIKGEQIAAVGELGGATAKRVVDATGLVVTPGFIDMHSHADQMVLLFPAGESSIGQGITTSVTGQCGGSPAPIGEYTGVGMWGADWRHKLMPAKYYPAGAVETERVRQAAREYGNFDFDWTTFGEWVDRVNRAKPGFNLVPLVGHGTIRNLVMGKDTKRAAKPDEVAAMERAIAEVMAEGAWGISTGMDYPPGAFATEDEVQAVVSAAAKYGGFFSPHWRRTGLRQGFGNPGLINGLVESLDVARATGAKIQVAHLSAGYLVSPAPTPRLATVAAEETLVAIDAAIKDGVDLAFDVIPNHKTGGILHQKYLAATLTPWFREAGSFEQFAANLMAPDLREEIKGFLMSGKWYPLNPNLQPGWANGMMVDKSSVAKYDGKSIAEIAKESGKNPLDALMDVIAADPQACGGQRQPYAMDEALRVYYSHPMATVGIDTLLADETFALKVPPYTYPNLNTFGGVARFLRLYAVGHLGLEEGVRRLTSLAAERLGLADRGVIAPDMKADLVVFDPAKVQECEDNIEPRQYPEGYAWVFVNGEAAMVDGKLTRSRSGRVLRHA